MMTEDEAKTKRCCGGSSCGKATFHYASDRICVGSECMAWRCNAEYTELQKGEVHENPSWKKDERQLPKHMSENNIWVYHNGYCGLAGKQ
jgi:hypothetical protein